MKNACVIVRLGRLLQPTLVSRREIAAPRCLSSKSPSSKRSLLPHGERRPFKTMNLNIRSKYFNMVNLNIDDFKRRLPYFTDDDWRLHLSVLGHPKDSFPRHQTPLMVFARDRATDWLLKNIDSIEIIDYYNYLCFLSQFSSIYKDHPLPYETLRRVADYFAKRFHRLTSEEFFTVFAELSVMSMEHQFDKPLLAESELSAVINHGITRANDTEVHDLLGFLRGIDYYSKLMKITPNWCDDHARRLMDAMAAMSVNKISPANLLDLKASLMYLSDVNRMNEDRRRSHFVLKRSILRRPDCAFHPGWNWLRLSIETIFDHKKLEHLRQSAALVAVRAYKWKAIDFSPEDIIRFLESAASPFLIYPDRIFHKEFQSDNYKAFIRLVYSFMSAASCDLPELNQMKVRLDNAFWDEFFDMLKRWVPKHPGYMRTMTRMMRDLNTIDGQLTARQSLLVSHPFNERRRELLRVLYRDATRLQSMLDGGKT